MAKVKNKIDNRAIYFLILIRILLLFIPQTGYIHPDEFFQTVEPLAGRIFEYDASLPHEFNVTSPMRSIAVPYFTIGLSYLILKTLHIFFLNYLNVSIITPYTLLIIPRLIICLMSFLVDYSLYKICISNNEKYKSRLIILGSSFVTIVFCSHTFTNSIETILFALLLYYVSDSITFSNVVVRQREYIAKRYESANTPAERAKFHKLRLFLVSDSFRNCLQISTITTLGFFNRPTFLCFAVYPIFFYLYRGIGFKSVTVMEFHFRIFVLLLGAIPIILIIILVDSFFYGYITWAEIGMLNISINNFVFPPINFVKYNMNSQNLAKHGLHPRYTHLLVNIPLLFNVLGVIALVKLLDIIYKLIMRKFNQLPTVRSIKGLMTTSFIAPTLLLSYFPHQEPRFLIPIILPLIYLYAHDIYKEADYEVAKSLKETLRKEQLEKKVQKPSSSNRLFKLWLFINAILTFYFGFLHQGGVYPATRYLSNEINLKSHFNYHIVTSHIYSIPHVLFMQPDTNKIFYNANNKHQITKHVFTYENGSKEIPLLLEQVKLILDVAAANKRRYKVYLMISGSLKEKLVLSVNGTDSLLLQHVNSFYPHLSGEALPNFSHLYDIIVNTDVKHLNISTIMYCILNIIQSFSINIYQVTLK